MEKKKQWRFDTRVIHEAFRPEEWQGATQPPIFQTASHLHPTAESLSDTFGGKSQDHIYMRLTNPTNRVLEQKIASLEGGKAAVVTGSGMAAITTSCMALLRAGDEFVTGNSLFMSTYLLFSNVFKKYGITPRFVEPTDIDAICGAINDKTRFIYIETIGNPKMDVPDIKKIAKVAHDHGLPLLVDNTLATPYLCRPIELGADVVIHSTTKYLTGHGCATGGVVIDAGTFDWESGRFSDFKPFVHRKGPLAYIDRVWREIHINFGTTQAPFHSYLTAIGLDTLVVRMERHLKNAMKVAEFLNGHPEVRWVRYPGLPEHPCHEVARTQFEDKGFGALISFGLKDQDACFRFINNLNMIYHLANLGDCKTLVIHPYSTQYLSFPEETRRYLSITPDLVRLSVGIEAVEDILDDIAQALEGLT
ncbi:O-acetylhomoserine sulfhydrylase [Dissulfuribacter thermophilus]|uniref:O-acetylhomoserine sulfhydrylase n=1 Tax=Dissulfuribacter thermophilus TaxID=1156395 RepID=A0A1B9F5Z9_9BACT|nr:aminotransferase class I/II-fold pyridoxal phosphate-dependent enzyme [Dissulfuribacter thermophilus]OCC15235.1 O-acetylhomoserine sulfhydrylase [Dissulfuribacter thermophilus]